MKHLLFLLLMAVCIWKGYEYFEAKKSNQLTAAESPRQVVQRAFGNGTTQEVSKGAASNMFNCDGRTHCSQMHSCEEATYFLQHCPNVKMDGNNDGVPCEQQWCTSQ
jgi:predicted negative regulator of RcsB-dependent stress response